MIPTIQECSVYWHGHLPGNKKNRVKVGTLARNQEHLYFGYDSRWISLEILCHRGNRCMGAFSYEPAVRTGTHGETLSPSTLNSVSNARAKSLA
ncbi:MAG: hypothetical protein RLZZ398_188 [Verrucomicrobiota bacterium]|jgi:hypothetical protein